MKQLLIVFILFPYGIMAQVKTEEPTLNYAGKFESDTFDFHVGEYLLFAQHCVKWLPTNIVNGSVLFDDYQVRKLKIRKLVTFTDTLVTAVVYQYKGPAVDSVLERLGLEQTSFTRFSPINSYYESFSGRIQKFCWLGDKELIYTEQLIQDSGGVKPSHLNHSKKRRRRP